MKEIVDFRTDEEKMLKYLGELVGTPFPDSDIRKIQVSTTSDLYRRLREAELSRKPDEPSVWFSVDIRRRYSAKELRSAGMFRLMFSSVFEPYGEECGTVYDISHICPHCGAGKVQEGPLFLDFRKTPKNADIARTIRHEWIISQRFAELLRDNDITGYSLAPVVNRPHWHDDPVEMSEYESGRKLLAQAEANGLNRGQWEYYVWLNRAEQKELWERMQMEYSEAKQKRFSPNRFKQVWYQLIITSAPIECDQKTEFRYGPFPRSNDSKFICPEGHVKGFNLWSELFLSQSTYDGSDFCITKEMVGWREYHPVSIFTGEYEGWGDSYPHPVLVVNRKLYDLIQREKVKGCHFEIAHLV